MRPEPVEDRDQEESSEFRRLRMEQEHELALVRLKSELDLAKMKLHDEFEASARGNRIADSLEENKFIAQQLKEIAAPILMSFGAGMLKVVEMQCKLQERLAELVVETEQHRHEVIVNAIRAAQGDNPKKK